MRRFFSIATVLALLSTMMSPVLAAACTGTGKAVSCHTAPMPHCDRTMHQHHHHADAEQPASTSGISVGESDSKCPMDCCTPGNKQNSVSPVTASLLPLITASDRSFQIASITFTSAGFS